jgi:hypothetical protein
MAVLGCVEAGDEEEVEMNLERVVKMEAEGLI